MDNARAAPQVGVWWQENNLPTTTVRGARRAAIVEHVQALRAFAITLTGDRDSADRVVEQIVVTAWTEIDSLASVSCMRMWLFKLLRDAFHADRKALQHPQRNRIEIWGPGMPVDPGGASSPWMTGFRDAFDALPDDQREALVLVGPAGFSYDEAAEICGSAPRVVKKCADRARAELALTLLAASMKGG